MKCKKCYEEIESNSNYCPYCGACVIDKSFDKKDEVFRDFYSLKSNQKINNIGCGNNGKYNEFLDFSKSIHKNNDVFRNSSNSDFGSHNFCETEHYSVTEKQFKNGKSKKFKWAILILIPIILLFIIGVTNLFETEDNDNIPEINVSRINYNNYRKIREGMSVEEVCDILGQPDFISNKDSSNISKIQTYMWFDGESRICVDFRFGSVISFTQEGLYKNKEN